MQICNNKIQIFVLFQHSFVIINEYTSQQTFGTSFGFWSSLCELEQSISLPCCLRNSQLQSLLTHSENTAVPIPSECPPPKDAFLTSTVLIGIPCYMMKANNYQDYWKEDHITVHKAILLTLNLYPLGDHSDTWFLYKFLLSKPAGCAHIDFVYCFISKCTY